MRALQRDVIQNYPGGGYNPKQKTFILMWNPAISSITIHNHIDSISHIDDWEFNWSVYEWEKAHEGDRFFMVRVGEGNTGIVMSGIFISEPYTERDWNRIRKNKEIHYMDMQPNLIVNPETMPIITTAQLQEAIPDFIWSKGHSGSLLTDFQTQRLEELFAMYFSSVSDRVDEENLTIKPLMDSHDLDCINAVLQVDADMFFRLIEDGHLVSHLMTDTKIFSDLKFPLHHITMLWDHLLSKYDNYMEEHKETVYRKKLQNDRIKEYFIKTYGFDMKNVPFANYSDCYSCWYPEATVEDIIGVSENELIEKGFSKKDIDLYCSVYKMDFETTKHLLEKGANPETSFANDDEVDNCWEHVCIERDFLSNEFDNKIIENEATPFEIEDIENLIGYSAYESMYSLLKSYSKKNRVREE